MILVSAVPVQHHYGVCARTRLRLTAVQGTPDRVLAIIIQNEVRMSIPFQPPSYLRLVTLESYRDHTFSRVSIRIRRRCGDVSLFTQSFRKLPVGSSDVTLQRVPTAGLVK